MSEYHPNTIKLLQIANEAIKLGWYVKYPKICFCAEVAKRSHELGNDYPSDKAIKIAERMLRRLKREVKKGKWGG